MPHFLLDENISVLFIPMNLLPEQDLSIFFQNNPVFTSEFFEYISRCQSQKRRKELLLSRFLFLYIMQTNNVNIQYYNSIKRKEEILINNYFPSPTQTVYLSISHTDKWMMLALYSASPIGIDIENSKRKTEKIKRFLNEKMLLNYPDINPSVLLFLWAIYESLCKLQSPLENQKKVLNRVLSTIKKSHPQKLNGFNLWNIPVYDYITLIWEDEIAAVTGCLIVKDKMPKKIKFYSIGKLEYETKKPCKMGLTRLLTCDTKLEINF